MRFEINGADHLVTYCEKSGKIYVNGKAVGQLSHGITLKMTICNECIPSVTDYLCIFPGIFRLMSSLKSFTYKLSCGPFVHLIQPTQLRVYKNSQEADAHQGNPG